MWVRMFLNYSKAFFSDPKYSILSPTLIFLNIQSFSTGSPQAQFLRVEKMSSVYAHKDYEKNYHRKKIKSYDIEIIILTV